MTATGVRLCWFCDRILVPTPTEPGHAVQHCGSPNCHWCLDCEQQRRAGIPK